MDALGHMNNADLKNINLEHFVFLFVRKYNTQ